MSGWGKTRAVPVRELAYSVRSLEPGTARDGRAAISRLPVVLLHGFSGSAEDWGPAASSLAAAGYHVHAVDLPGHGLTPSPSDPARFGAGETARDLADVAASLGLVEAHWIGYSMGGRVALHVAIASPERVASLILESTSPGIEGSAERESRRAEDDALAARIEARGVAWFAEYWESLPLFASQSALDEAARAALRARRLGNTAWGLAGSLRGLGQGAQQYLGPRLPGVRRPTLLVTGALDAKYVALVTRMAAAIPDAAHVTIPGAGHNVHLEQPEAFARALLDRLSRIEEGSRREAPQPS